MTVCLAVPEEQAELFPLLQKASRKELYFYSQKVETAAMAPTAFKFWRQQIVAETEAVVARVVPAERLRSS
jgi:hypothetical protein